ncbi:MAG: purine-binding chemotaxis protein CheW [Deltaproteobacteria bacterium]|nr:purine-binding chemotaxis protein CheW [Deltaproteobacteria bacterium]
MTTSIESDADGRLGASRGESAEIVFFTVGDIVCGLDVLQIQEIKKIHTYTPVHGGPAYVRGLVNLRGQIITLIDVRARLGLSAHSLESRASAVVVPIDGELVGLLVDSIGDVVQADPDRLRPAPANLHGIEGHFFTGVLMTSEGLVALMDRDRIAGLDPSLAVDGRWS